jgi:membrane protein implicated in regulation of membrane protease activity
MNAYFIFWCIICFISVVLELVSPGLFFFLSFAIGSIFSGIVSLLDFDLTIQLAVFLITSIISFFSLRIWLKMTYKDTLHKTNVYALLGKKGIVVEDIKIPNKGLVKVNGEIWSAISKSGQSYYKNTIVEVIDIKGINIIVQKASDSSKL